MLATDTTIPTTAPWSAPQPRKTPTPSPSPVDSRIPSGPPPSATHFTGMRSFSENSMPIENINSTTPISAKSSKVWTSETDGPGVHGLTRSPPAT